MLGRNLTEGQQLLSIFLQADSGRVRIMDQVRSVTGSLSIKWRDQFYVLFFPENGWLAGELVQYLDDVLQAARPETAILKLLGYTLQIRGEAPKREADQWVEVDLERKVLATNSELIRKAVKQLPPNPEDPFFAFSLRNTYAILDKLDFEVHLSK